MNQYPKTIDNGHGETLTFLGRVNRDGTEYLQVENFVTPGFGPPMHVHLLQNESLTVVKGTMAIQVMGEEPRFLKQGESATFEKGVIHRFWNAGDTPLKCTGEVWPAHNLEYFLSEIYRSTKENNGRPGPFDAAFLLSRYKTEFDMAEIPAFVKKVIFPLTLFIGKIRGQHLRYKDAPLPFLQ
jgi:quercetin dioxygenase-like cupin family protein